VPVRVRVNPQAGGLNPKGGGVGLEFTQSGAMSSIPWGLPTQDQQSAHGDGDGQSRLGLGLSRKLVGLTSKEEG